MRIIYRVVLVSLLTVVCTSTPSRGGDGDCVGLTTLAQYDSPNFGMDAAVVGQLMYLANGFAGLQVLEVSDPSDPVRIGGVDTPGFALGIDDVGDFVYLTDESEGVRVIDVSDLEACIEVGSLDTSGLSQSITVIGNLAYLADWDAPVRLIAVDGMCSQGCPVDFNHDGVLDFYDVSIWINAWIAGDLSIIDMNGDGTLSFFDFSIFLSALNEGCP